MVVAIAMTLICLLRAGSSGREQSKIGKLLASRGMLVALLLVSIVTGVTYFYGTRNRSVWVHRWDQFHTVIGARYFDELGYSRLYVCAYAFDQANGRHFPILEKMRDLRGDSVRKVERAMRDHDCDERFSPERKQRFLADIAFFAELLSPSNWRDLFKDKGFNSTPFHTALAGAIAGDSPLSLTRLHAFAFVDLILLGLAFFAAWRAFGAETALVAFLFFCVNFPNNFQHMGGSLLRFDYVAALIGAVSALRLRQPLLAGALVSYGAFARIYPGLFAVGYGLKVAYDYFTTRRIEREHRLFALGFTASSLCFLLVSLAPGGFSAWREWLDNMLVHTKDSAGFRIGFQHLFMLHGNLMGEDGFVGYREKAKLFADLKPLYYASVWLLLAPAVLLVRRLRSADFATYFTLTAFFLLFVATRYYYSLLVLGCFLLLSEAADVRADGKVWLLRGALFMTAGIAWVASRFTDFSAFLYNTLFSSLMLACVLLISALLVHHPRRA